MSVANILHPPVRLSIAQIEEIEERVHDLIERLVPIRLDRNGVLELTHEQRWQIICFKEWLQDAYGPEEVD